MCTSPYKSRPTVPVYRLANNYEDRHMGQDVCRSAAAAGNASVSSRERRKNRLRMRWDVFVMRSTSYLIFSTSGSAAILLIFAIIAQDVAVCIVFFHF